jgi:hypothetical protein
MSSEVPDDEWAFTQATQRLHPSVPGMASTIHLLTEFVVDIGVNPIIDLQVNWLTMAITLVHEVTHALHIYCFGDRQPEPLFEDDDSNELGNALEQFLFQGQFHICDITKALPTCTPLPRSVMTAKGVLIIMEPHLAANSPDGNAYAIRKEWLQSLFSDEFWAGELLVLLPRKDFVARVKQNDEGDWWLEPN